MKSIELIEFNAYPEETDEDNSSVFAFKIEGVSKHLCIDSARLKDRKKVFDAHQLIDVFRFNDWLVNQTYQDDVAFDASWLDRELIRCKRNE